MNFTLSNAEENYLKAIYHLTSTEHATVTTNALSESMDTKPSSVNDMFKRLSQKQVVTYKKYKGAQLTPIGTETALSIVRKHRLWEVFLVDKLKFNWDQVHEIAEQLEHIHSPLLTERLDEYLGRPAFDPHGDPIPDKDGNFTIGPTLLLSEFQVGGQGVVTTVGSDDIRLLQYLDKVNIRPGTRVEVLELNEFDGSMEVAIDEGKGLFLSNQICSQLMISKTE